jgi:hypothetical protein
VSIREIPPYVLPTPTLVAGPTFITATTPAAGTTSTAYIDLAGMGTPAFTAQTGKSYKVFAILQPGNVVSGQQTTVAICNASDNSVIREQGYVARAANDSFQIILADLVVPGAGSYSAKVRIKTSATGTAFVLAGSTFRGVIWIEQVN